jgi:hypothetical protein
MTERWTYVYDGSSTWSIGPEPDPQSSGLSVMNRDDVQAIEMCEKVIEALNRRPLPDNQS